MSDIALTVDIIVGVSSGGVSNDVHECINIFSTIECIKCLRAVFYVKMPCSSLFICRFRLALLGLHVTRRHFASFVPVAAFYKKLRSCYCHPAVFGGCLSVSVMNSTSPNFDTVNY